MVLEGKVKTIDGGEIEVQGSSICLHGDNPQSPEIVTSLKKKLEKHDIKIAPKWFQNPISGPMAVLQTSDKCSHTLRMLRFLDRPAFCL
jgi:hypothetical protein